MKAILKGREERVKKRNQFINETVKEFKLTSEPDEDVKITFVSLTVNLPGRDKNSAFAVDLLSESYRSLLLILLKEEISVFNKRQINNEAGPVIFLAVSCKQVTLKEICIWIEENHYSGRLFDLDVINEKGVSFSRRMLGKPLRKCFICEFDAKECMRKGNHPPEEMEDKLADLEREFYQKRADTKNKFACKIEQIAGQVILQELAITPKPGLVDLHDSGTHKDMNKEILKKSALTITPYFKEFFLAGMLYSMENKKTLDHLREIGKKAERDMFKITEGINTHKGVIFSLGLLSAAVGSFYYNPFPTEIKTFSQVLSLIVSGWTQGIIERDLEHLKKNGKLTHGQVVYEKYGFAGARGAAEDGYKLVLNHALPAYKNGLDKGLDDDQAAITALLQIMARLDDTNILYRSDLVTLRRVQSLSNDILNSGGMLTDTGRRKYKSLLNYVQKKGISPGGAADLLTVCLFFFEIDKLPANAWINAY